MQGLVGMFVQDPFAPLGLRPGRRSPAGRLTHLRDQIAILRAIDFDHATIGKTLRISPEDARALSPKTNKPDASRRLKRHAINALLCGRYAHVGGRATATRAKNLVKIASAYSLQELLDEPGVGNVTAIEIQLWLEERGVALRPQV